MSKPKLLLADDSLTIQKVINLTFADEGIDVITVGDGDTALREIAQSVPDIVLADVHMPGPSGYEICSLLRSIEETAELPVILLVGAFEQFDPAEADRAGANAYVTKPFQSIRQLVDQVKGFINIEGGPEPDETDIDETPQSIKDEADTTDIDNLYDRSVAETVEMPGEMAATAGFANDDFIESSYAADQPDEPVEFQMPPEGEVDFDDIIVEETTSFESSSTSEISLDEDFEQPVYDDLPSAAEKTAEVEAAVTQSEFQTAPTEEFRHDARDPFSSAADNFDLDEIDLLGITPATTTQEFRFTTQTDAADQGSKAQVVSLSPELMDVIVQKVVEKLSEKY